MSKKSNTLKFITYLETQGHHLINTGSPNGVPPERRARAPWTLSDEVAQLYDAFKAHRRQLRTILEVRIDEQ